MKIVHVNTFDIQGGAARAAWHLHDQLRRASQTSNMLAKVKVSGDSDVHSFTFDSESRALKRWAKLSYKYISRNRTGVTDCMFSLPVPGFDLALHPAIKSADVIHLHWITGLLAPAGIARLLQLGKPVVWTLHDQRAFTGGCHYSFGCQKYETTCHECPQLGNRAPNLSSGVLAEAVRTFDARAITVVTPSQWLARCAEASTLFRDSPIHAIPNGIDTAIFRPMPRAEARRKLGIDPNGLCFLFGADTIRNRRKGISVFLEALALCLEDETFRRAVDERQIRFLTYGDGSEKEVYGGLPVHGFGQLDSNEKLALVYAASDVFICPTLEDNLPTTILESLGCGTPVLATEVGGVPDMVENERNGLLVKPGDAHALAHAMKWIVANQAVLPAWSENARKGIEANFSLSLQASRMIDLYAGLLSRNLAPATPASAATDRLPLMPRAWKIKGPLRRNWPKWLRFLSRAS
jgi:glycosyltransferase involved in cell wall biosynthesis